VLTRILVHLLAKPAAFRVIDTHAGAGLYDLAGPEAGRTNEWRNGIARVRDAVLPPAVRALLASYLDAVAAHNPSGKLVAYPGSPALVRNLLRPQDRLLACELEPGAAAALARTLRGDARLKAVAIDGWTALSAYVPPKERRGLVLIDPPFEAPDDFTRLALGLAAAHRKWPTGIYLLWYPIKDRSAPDALARRLQRIGLPKLLRAELTIAPHSTARVPEKRIPVFRKGHAPAQESGAHPDSAQSGCAPERLNGSGLIIVNPPWTLEGELRTLLPALAGVLADGARGASRIDWLAGEKP
jgi:23S rRNA (adenine2030-N6)-methyltransferase